MALNCVNKKNQGRRYYDNYKQEKNCAFATIKKKISACSTTENNNCFQLRCTIDNFNNNWEYSTVWDVFSCKQLYKVKLKHSSINCNRFGFIKSRLNRTIN
jgi:hypothetical protein